MEKTFNKDSNKQLATILQKQFVYNHDSLNVLRYGCTFLRGSYFSNYSFMESSS